jgi:hypothetical protein
MNLLQSTRAFPLAVLVAAVLLRFGLVAGGGQYFHFDEARHERAIWIYTSLWRGDTAPLRAVAAMPEHGLFPWVGVGVTAVQHLVAQATAHGDWSRPENVAATTGIGAAVLSLFSALNLLLAWRLARVLGATHPEANAALLLMAVSNTAFYHARFLLPYDCAIAAVLVALLLVATRPTLGRTVAGGVVLGFAYHLYNGYWYVVPLAWGALVGIGRGQTPLRNRAIVGGVGVAAGGILPVAVGVAAGGDEFLAAMRDFSRSATQGAFAEGWSLPWEYAWHSEGMMGLLLAGFLIWAGGDAWRERRRMPGWGWGSLAVLAGGYALLVLFSVGLERIVVYARTLKPMVVPACLLGGWALARVVEKSGRLGPAVVAAVALGGALRLAPHFAQVFPREVEAAVTRQFGIPKRTLSVTGAIYLPSRRPVTRPDLLLVDAQNLFPIAGRRPVPAGRTLLRVDHPLAYLPLQYEGYSPRERALLRSADLSIRLLQLERPAEVPDDLPASERYQPPR